MILADNNGVIESIEIADNHGSQAINDNKTEYASLNDMEHDMVRRAIEKNSGNLSAAATQLGITRQTLYNKMKRYGL